MVCVKKYTMICACPATDKKYKFVIDIKKICNYNEAS